MFKVLCLAAILAVATAWPQGGVSGINYQFPYSSQSIQLHTDEEEDHPHQHHEFDDNHHHLEVYHPIDEKYEIGDNPVEPPKVREENTDLPMLHIKKQHGIEMPNLHNEKYRIPLKTHQEFPKHSNEPKNYYDKNIEFPKTLHEKLPMSMMMMQHELPKDYEGRSTHSEMSNDYKGGNMHSEIPKDYEGSILNHDLPKFYEERKIKHEHPKKHEEHKKHEDHHKKHEENHHADYHNPKYQYDYKVEDPHSGDYKTHHESRHGDTVHGFYAIHEADGTTRIVEYTADQHDGFKATVRHEGQPTHAA